MFPESRDGGDPDRVIRLELDSPALAVAAPRAADRFSTSVSSVLLAAEAALVGHITGHAVCAMQLIAVNRLEPRAEGMVGSVTGNALFSVELAGADFAELAARTHRRAMVAYRHGQCDTYALDDVEAGVAAQRGAKFDLGVFFNDARARDRVPELAADEAAAALSRRGVITQTGSWPRQDATFFMTASDGPASMKLSIMADTEVSPRPVIEAALRGIEELIVRAATATSTLPWSPTRLAFPAAPPPVPRDDRAHEWRTGPAHGRAWAGRLIRRAVAADDGHQAAG